MEESDVASFALWSLVTAALMGIAAWSYRAYLGRQDGGADQA